MTYLLDNNVLSELWKPKPDSAVVSWFFSSEWLLPVPVIAEIQEFAATECREIGVLDRPMDLQALKEAISEFPRNTRGFRVFSGKPKRRPASRQTRQTREEPKGKPGCDWEPTAIGSLASRSAK